MHNSRCLVIIPAYNEEQNLNRVIHEVRSLGLDLDLVVINDGSRDGTEAVARAAGEKVITLPFNLGYGGALQTGFKFASGLGYNYIIQFDADGQHHPGSIPEILSLLEDGEADIVIGSRYLGRDGVRASLLKKIAVSVFRFLIRVSTGTSISDPTSGLQGLSRRVFTHYAELGNYPEDYPDADTLIYMILSGYRVVEVPVEMRERYSGRGMHVGLKTVFYFFKMLVSILVVLIREKSGRRVQNNGSDLKSNHLVAGDILCAGGGQTAGQKKNQ